MTNPFSRFESLMHIADMLRLTAETVRLFSNTGLDGSNRLSQITQLSLRIEEDADALEELAKSEVQH